MLGPERQHTYLSILFIVIVCEHLSVGHEVCPEGGAPSIEGQAMSLFVTVTQERPKPNITSHNVTARSSLDC